MKNLRKVTAGALSVAVLSLSAITALAANADNIKVGEIIPISDKVDKEAKSFFGSFKGTVKEIRNFEGVEGSKFVLVEDEKGGMANFVVSKDTYFVNDAEIAVGSVITGFYEAGLPMIMIYPPQYQAKVIAVDSEGQNIKVDRFDENLISQDNELKLNISDKTEIILQDGKKFEGELANRMLVALYGPATKSIPAQTTPDKVVVLFERAVPPIHELTPEEKAGLMGDVSTMDIVVSNKKIEAPAAYTDEKGTVMVPLRAIAEGLELDVAWDGEQQSIRLGKGISLKIGEDNYNYMKTAPIQLGTAPVLVGDKTFVPLSFFREVARLNNAYVFEGQIVIDDNEKMQ